MTQKQLLEAPPMKPGAPGSRERSKTAGALVIGSTYRALGIVRSLGRRGIPVWVVVDGEDVLAAKSRYAGRRLTIVGETAAEQATSLTTLADEHAIRGWTLFPTTDVAASMVALEHDLLATCFSLTTPPWDVLRWAYDKRLTYEIAGRIGLPQPRTQYAQSADEAASLPLEFPVIVKPAVKESFNRLTAAKAWRADSPPELFDRFGQASELLDPEHLLIQELIPGGGDMQYSVAALADRGRLLATVVARRTRQYPADFGRASTFVETVEQPELLELSQQLLDAMRFTGLVEVEFKRDPRDERFKLLDVNPRVWGWHSLCQRAGVDFPYLAHLLARSEVVPDVHAEVGVRWLRLSTDLPNALREIAHGRLSPRAYIGSFRGPRESAIFARDDPWPALVELPMLAGLLVRRLLRGDGV